MLNPADSCVDWVMTTVPTMGAGWCPPGMLGIVIGGTAEKAMLLAKQALMEPIDIQELMHRGPKSKLEELRIELYRKVNALGIGDQGLGGLNTVLAVKILDYPTHAANLPIATLCQNDFQHAVSLARFEQAHPGGARAAIGQIDAVAQLIEHVRRRLARYGDVICLRYAMRRLGQAHR